MIPPPANQPPWRGRAAKSDGDDSAAATSLAAEAEAWQKRNFGGVDGQKIASTFFRSIFISTHHFLSFYLFFLSVPANLVRKQCGRRLRGQLVNSLPKVHSKVR
jgi:hypothetical protein